MSRDTSLDALLARTALECLPEGITITNPAGDMVYVNRAAHQRLGLDVMLGPPERWIAHFGLFRGDGVTLLRTADLPSRRAFAGEAVREVEAVIRNVVVPEGARVLVSASTLVTNTGEPHAAVVVLRDVSDTWRARIALKEREHYLHAILDNLPDMAWLKDREGRFVAVNEQLARALGRPVSEIVGKRDIDVSPRELAERYRADDLEIMEARTTKRIEEPFVAGDGTETVIETIKTAIVDEHGDVIGSTGIARDITERKQSEARLQQSKDDLERRFIERTRELERAQELSVRKERLAVLGQLAGGVAHQIRNPLAAMKNASYVLERSLPMVGVTLPEVAPLSRRRSSFIFGERGPDGVLRLTPEQQVAQSLAIIHEEIRRANDIISGLLDYARIRAPVRQVVAARELVTQVLASAEIPATVQVKTRLGDARVALDPSQVQEALHVLVRNAVDAMPESGTLTITSHDEGTWVMLSVEDTGIGVPADIAERLFEPLQTSKPMGLGLGLVTARTLVEAQGGQLTFVARAGAGKSGARFELRLPRAP